MSMQMTTRGSSRIVMLGVVAVLAVGIAVLGAKYLRSSKDQLPTPPGQQQLVAEKPADVVSLSPNLTSGTDTSHLLTADFKIVNQMAEITQGCREIFESSFTTPVGAPASAGQLAVADPGHDFESTDAIRGGLPFRRLEFGGLGGSRCFIYYQHGGAMYPRFCLAVIDTEHTKTLWVGEARERARDLEQLRGMLLHGDFDDKRRPEC